ncbi:MAG: PAT family beta-lactamase induction signal transducer AmpG [Candidatus Azotimanducaceae bacterium]|jgi:PAT family beta-lactamase induction signal transducer AmpG
MNLYLSESRIIRFSSFAIYYIAQGLPIGLISVALPAWLAENNVDTLEIASFIAITGLPWGFKLLAGPIMDRFSFLAMGRRRPWVIGAQFGLLAAMLAMAFVPDPIMNLKWLIAAGFVVNTFAAMQDVAVDGMAIDTLPENERGRANSFMAFGQVAGYSLSGAFCAMMLVSYGLQGAVLSLTIGIAIIFVWVLIVRERIGERLLPWTEGQASSRSLNLQAKNWLSIFSNLRKVLFLPTSLLLILITFTWRVSDGFWLVSAPIIVVQDLHFQSTEYSYWTSICTGIAAIMGLFLGPVIDKIGARIVFITALGTIGIVYIFIGSSLSFWHSSVFLLGVLAIHSIIYQACFISFIALHMSICWDKVSATQFAIYMAWANLARSIGASIYGEIKPSLAQGQEFYIMGLMIIVAAILLMCVKIKQHKEQIETLEDNISGDMVGSGT